MDDEGANHSLDNFFFAASEGWLAEVRRLIIEGTDVNARNFRGETALMIAADGNHTEVVKLLLDYGADVNACDNDTWTAVQEAAQINAIEIVDLLLEHGADIMGENNFGWNLLYIAKRNENELMVRLVEKHSKRQSIGRSEE